MNEIAKRMWHADADKAKFLVNSIMRQIRAHKAVGKDFTDEVKRLCTLVEKLTSRED